MRIDHVENYRLPKSVLEREEKRQQSSNASVTDTRAALKGGPGHAYDGKQLANVYNLEHGQDLFAPAAAVAAAPSENKTGARETTALSDQENPQHSNDELHRKAAKLERKEYRRQKREERELRRQKKYARPDDRDSKKREQRRRKENSRDTTHDTEGRRKKKHRRRHSSRSSRDDDDRGDEAS